MKIYPRQIAFIVLVLFTTLLRAQTTSLEEVVNIMPEKGWPECAVPENLQIIRLNEGIQVEFLDAETFKDYYYEIEFVSQTDNILIFSSDISAQRFSISYEKLESRTDLKVKVRRVCLGNNMLKYFSNWWENVAESECTPGVIAGGGTMCPGIAPQSIISSQPGSGGTGIYLWKEKSGGCASSNSWNNATGTNNQEQYTPPVLSATKSYKRVYSCGETNCITYTVSSNNLNAGSITGAQTVCSNVLPSELQNVSSPSGGTAETQTSVDYIWQSSASQGSGYSDISGSNKLNYSPGYISSNTYFRRKAMLGSCNDSYTSAVLVTASPAPQITISKSPTTPVCAGSNVSLTASGGYNYIWSTGNSGSVTTVAPTQTTEYIVTATNYSGNCPSTASSNVFTQSCLDSRYVVINFNSCNNSEFNVTGVLTVSNALSGDYVYIVEQISGMSDTIQLVAGVQTYPFQILNIPYTTSTGSIFFSSPSVYISPNLSQISVNYSPQGKTPPILEGDFDICKGQTTNITVNNFGNQASYSWSNGQSSQTLNIQPLSTVSIRPTTPLN